MRLRALAKINLGLDILGKREDGYHDVRMIMQTISMYDVLDIQKKETPGISLWVNLPYIPSDERNLVYRAAKLLMDEFQISEGVSMRLEKFIPVAAGMAGGSSDAAAALVGINRLFHLGLSEEELMERAVQIGADVPFCIVGGTCLAQGIGEVLSPLKPMPSCHIVLAKPDFGVNTGKAYGLFDTNGKTHNADQLGMLTAVQNRDLPAICGKLDNVFEQFVEVPGRIEMKEVLRAAGAAGVGDVAGTH